MRIEIVRDADADALLADEAFARRWAALYRECRWATAFQSREFVHTWWSWYRDRHEPLFILGGDPDGELSGLLPLAIDGASGSVAAAGAHQSEYQGWLARDSDGEFITRALAHLHAQVGTASLAFLWLPPGTPLGRLASDPQWARRTLVREWSRPLVDLGDGSAIEEELKRRKLRYWLRALERYGPVTFERLTRPEELEKVLDEIVAACDLQQAVRNDAEPFAEDAAKRAYHVALMRDAHLLHVSVMRAGGRFVSGQLNLFTRPGEVLLGVLSHSPFFARSSPGTLHLLRVARELAREGTAVFDLTPGGEPGNYKERFATRHDTVHSIQVFFDWKAHVRASGRRAVATAGRRALAGVGLSPARVKGLVHSPPRALARDMWRSLRSLNDHRSVRLYTTDLTRVVAPSGPEPVRRDSISDLLAPFDGDAPHGSRREFLAASQRRLERDEHVYTHVKNGRLTHVGWLAPPQTEVHVTEVGQGLRLTEPAVVLHDFYTQPVWRNRGICQAAVRHVLSDAARLYDVRTAYAFAPADAAEAIHVLEKLGFELAGTLHERRRFGRVERSAELATGLQAMISDP